MSVGGGAEEAWRLEGVGAPHDIALVAAPVPAEGNGERSLAVLVAECKLADNGLRKYIFVPVGTPEHVHADVCVCGCVWALSWGVVGP